MNTLLTLHGIRIDYYTLLKKKAALCYFISTAMKWLDNRANTAIKILFLTERISVIEQSRKPVNLMSP